MPTKLIVAIDADSAAFEHDYLGELARILRRWALHLSDGPVGDEGPLVDMNGNTVGSWTLVELADEPTDAEIEAESAQAYEDYVCSGGLDHEDPKIVHLLHHDPEATP
jgi:hypothetical protein